MNTLVIEKQTGGYFKFTLNGDTANAITSIQNDLLAVGTQLHFKTGNGANIIKEQFIYPADVTIIASGTFTFTTVAQVWDKLIDIDYFAWLGGGGTGGVDRFDDLLDTFSYTGNAGKAVVVDGSELRLVPITLYNKRLFTELEDTPSSLVPNKMLVVNPAGTAVVLQDQPEQPEQLLNSVGYFDYNDLATQTTPLNAVANVALKLTNDTEGANTSTDQNPYGVSYVWDYTTNQFNFTELEVGDTIDVRIHVQVTTTSANQKVVLSAKFGIGSVSEFTNVIYENQFKSAGLHEINFVAPFYMGSAYITDNPAELYLTSDASATVKVDGWYVRILRKNINIITVDYQVPDATTLAKGIVRLAGDLGGNANNPTVPELANKVPNTRTVSTTSPLLGGGALSSNLTLSIQQANSVDSGYLSYVDWSTFNGKANDSAVVHLAGTETITGVKTFSADTIINGVTVGKGGASEVGNTAVGQNALSNNTSGILNTAIGFESLLNNTGGGDNTSLGWWSLKSNTTGNSNVSAGTASLANNTTGFGNTSLGWNSLAVSTTGAFNSALGYLAGSSFGGSDSNANTLTSYSIYIGYKAGPLANSQTNQIVIGKNAVGAGSNTVTIGNTDITTTILRGEVQAGSFKKDSGTSSQFLKADGSVDSTTYALDNAVVKLTGDQSITGSKSFTTNTAAPAMVVTNNSTDNGILLQNTSTGNALRINNGALSTGDLIRAGKDGNVTFIVNQNGNTTAASFIKSGGTSSQFLKADGSVDSSTYLTSLSGAVLTTGDQSIAGDKTFTTANRTTFQNADFAQIRFKNTTDLTKYLDIGYGSNGNMFSSTGLDFRVGGLTTAALSIASNENATFRENLTAKSFIKSGGTSSQFLKADGSIDSTTYQTALTNPVTGTGTTNYIPKFTGASAIGNSQIFDNGTSVGIGTTSPSPFALVDANGQFRVSNLTVQGFYQARKSDTLSEGVFGGNSFVLRNGSTSEDLNFDIFNRSTSAWYTPMVIKNTGNVGIGTTSPTGRLTIQRASSGAETDIDFLNEVGAGPKARIRFGGTNEELSFWAGGTTLTERMRITSGGNVAIGTTSSTEKLTVEDSTGSSLFRLKHTGSTWSSTMIYGTTVATSGGFDFIGMYANGTAKFNVSSTGVVTASGGFFNSDIRLKDLVDYEYNVESIKPITYVWKDSEDKKRKIGYSAQEVQSILPEAVKEDREGFLSVDYIQVLVAKISELENRIKQLEK